MKIVPICLLSFLSVLPELSQAQSATTPLPEANPGRPTVSTPATLTPVGYLQFENGALFAQNSTEFSKRIGIGKSPNCLYIRGWSCSCRLSRLHQSV